MQSPSGYYGFRTMRGFDEKNSILQAGAKRRAAPTSATTSITRLVENIEVDCARRIERMENGEPRRFLLTMGGAGAQRDLFQAIIEHVRPMVDAGEATLFVNLGDHAENWEWLQEEMGSDAKDVHTHFTWEDTQGVCR